LKTEAAFGQGIWVSSKQARPDQWGESYAVRKTAPALEPAASVLPCFVSCASSGDNQHLETLALPLALATCRRANPMPASFRSTRDQSCGALSDSRRKPSLRSLRIRL